MKGRFRIVGEFAEGGVYDWPDAPMLEPDAPLTLFPLVVTYGLDELIPVWPFELFAVVVILPLREES